MADWGFLLLAAVAWWAYAPGLSGSFLFDDFNNLNQLGDYGRVDNLKSLLLYLTSGTADPTGRPLSLLSFLIDATNWPADPAPFKRTNLLLHICNGLLLAWVLLRLSRRLELPWSRAWAGALLGAALWTLHPLFVSTTLYVVQREAMLPAAFTLLGILSWVEGSERLADGRRGGWAWLIAGAWGCTVLAVLSKGNGALLPLLLLAVDWAIPGVAPSAPADGLHARRLRRARAVLLGAPSVFLVGWLLSMIPAAFGGPADLRPWTVGQRLLTEPRVLWDYLACLWLPRADTAGVFNDNFPVGQDWLHPWTTLPALAALALLLGLGFGLRRLCPPAALAIVFYFAGQLLESTVIPLELYYEHRNYLPALFMFWPLALWLTGGGKLRNLRFMFAATLLIMLAALCHARAGAWGRPYEQALLLAQINGDSPRAQANAASYEMSHGRPDLAAARLKQAHGRMPNEVQIALNWVTADCANGAVATQASLEAAHYALSHDRKGGALVRSWLINAIDTARQGRCAGLDLHELETMIGVLPLNQYYAADTWLAIHDLEGRLALARGDAAQALADFNDALAAFPTPDRALEQAAALGNAGFPALGLEHLRFFRTLAPMDRGDHGMATLHLWLLDRYGYWNGELTHMQNQLEQDAASVKRNAAE